MKKYRLKNYIRDNIASPIFREKVEVVNYWLGIGICTDDLEEVPSRIELYSRPRCEGKLDNRHTKIIVGLQKTSGDIFTDQEKDLCEKALNGELLDIDSLDDDDFQKWWEESPLYAYKDGITEVLKQYLKEKK